MCIIQLLYRYRHSNLVDLMGYCVSPPALVYEFMEGGSLFDRLHKQKEVVRYVKLIDIMYQ